MLYIYLFQEGNATALGRIRSSSILAVGAMLFTFIVSINVHHKTPPPPIIQIRKQNLTKGRSLAQG